MSYTYCVPRGSSFSTWAPITALQGPEGLSWRLSWQGWACTCTQWLRGGATLGFQLPGCPDDQHSRPPTCTIMYTSCMVFMVFMVLMLSKWSMVNLA